MTLGFASNSRMNDKSDALKQQLLECVQNEKVDFSKIADDFFQRDHHSREDYLTLTASIVAAVDHVLESGDWDDSLFLRNTVKPLKQIRETALALQEQANATSGEQQMSLRSLNEDETLVYISIFQSEGHNIRKWELQLDSLQSHLLGRPIYQNEEDVQKMIRRKLVQLSEAYVSLAIKKTDIQEFAYQAKRIDRYGNTLLALKENVVKPENIFEFVHQGKRYYFVEGKLVAC